MASCGYKNWLQFEHYTHSVFNFYFFGKNSPANVLTRTQTWSQLRSMDAKAWVSTLRATRPWRHNLCALPLVRCKTIDPFSTTSSESQESYLTTGMLPYKHSSFFPPTHGSIMLTPRQPRVFARLARWQLETSNFALFVSGLLTSRTVELQSVEDCLKYVSTEKSDIFQAADTGNLNKVS